LQLLHKFLTLAVKLILAQIVDHIETTFNRYLMKLLELDLHSLLAVKTVNHLEVLEVLDIFCVDEIVNIIVRIGVSIIDSPVLPRNVKGVLRIQLLCE